MGEKALSGRRESAIYARYSTDLQGAHSVEDQVDRLKQRIRGDGGTDGSALVFSDSAESGALWQRPGLQALLRAVAENRVSAVYVEDVSRLSRDVEDAARIRKRLEFHDVRLVSVGDGIELGGSTAGTLAYDVKTIIAEVYLRDLRDKTLRGMQARARKGKATGGRTFGYATDAEGDIRVVPEQADVIRAIFARYASGMGYARIASELNAEGIDPPRASARRESRGWMASCIRAMLLNSKYVGDFSFGRRKWVKDPDKRTRLPRKRAEEQVLTLSRPELAIVDRGLWDSVQAKLQQRRARNPGESRPPQRRTEHLLSSLLICDTCGALMELSGGGTRARYYRCSANRKRGTCENRLSVREDVARERILFGIREAIASPQGIAYMRKKLAEKLGELDHVVATELSTRLDRLKRTGERIKALVLMQADGDRSEFTAELRRDLESQAATEKAAIAELESRAETPIRLPRPDDVVQRMLNLERILTHDPEAGREALRRLLKDGRIRLRPGADGIYIARCEILPLAVMLDDGTKTPLQRDAERRGCPEVVAGAGFEPTTFGL